MTWRFPPPWLMEQLPGGFVVKDANGQSLAYFYASENDHDAHIALGGNRKIESARQR
jgi:hypothetical protein